MRLDGGALEEVESCALGGFVAIAEREGLLVRVADLLPGVRRRTPVSGDLERERGEDLRWRFA
jgi:hypothetical protein